MDRGEFGERGGLVGSIWRPHRARLFGLVGCLFGQCRNAASEPFERLGPRRIVPVERRQAHHDRLASLQGIQRRMKDGQPATRPFDYVLTEVQNQPVSHLKFAEYIKLANLAPGRYQAAIETKDMVTRKLVKQEASFEIVP